jgi:hypothetical protein
VRASARRTLLLLFALCVALLGPLADATAQSGQGPSQPPAENRRPPTGRDAGAPGHPTPRYPVVFDERIRALRFQTAEFLSADRITDVLISLMKAILIAAAQNTRDVLKEPHPFVLQTALDDFYVTYDLNAYTNKANEMAGILSDLHQNIQDRFNEAGVEIMSPRYAALREGNRTAIPDQYLPTGYEAPGVRVHPFGFKASGRDPDEG